MLVGISSFLALDLLGYVFMFPNTDYMPFLHRFMSKM